jgi:hypothetical protein
MKFAAFLISLVAISSFVSADELDAKVTFRSAAQPLKSVIAAVSKDTGVQLSVPAFLGSEPVIVQVKDVTLRDFMAKVSECVGGEWQKSGTSYQLAYTSRHETADRARTQLALLPKVIAEQGRITKELREMGAYTREQARNQAEQDAKNRQLGMEPQNPPGNFDQHYKQVTTPGLYCLKKLVASLDPKMLVQIPINARTVYSTNPTQMQRVLPASANSALNDYARLHAMYVAELASQPQPKMSNGAIIMMDQNANKPMNGPLGKALVVAFRTSSNSISFNLMVADQRGNIVSQSNLMLNLRDVPPEVAPNSTSGAMIEFSDSAKQHSTLLQYAPANAGGDIMVMRTGSRSRVTVGVMVTADGSATGAPVAPMAKPVVTPEWRAKLLSPDKFEPLSFAVSEAYLNLAVVQKANLIALLPDSAAVRLASRVAQGMTAAQLVDLTKSSCESEVLSTDGWTVVRPLDPILARLKRPSRVPAGNMLKSIATEGRLGLDTLATYLQSQYAKYVSGGFLDRYCGLIVSEARTRFTRGAGQEFELTKLWGLLDPLRKRQLIEGGKLELRLLGPAERSLVHSLVFDTQGGPNIDPPQVAGGGPVNRTVRAFSTGGEGFFFGGGSEFLFEERTEYLAAGIPASGFIQVEMEDEDAVMASSPTSEESKLFTARELGIYRSVSANKNLPENARGGFTSYESFKMGKRITYSISIELTDRASLSGNLMDALMPPGNSYAPYDQLPAEFRKEVENTNMQMKFGEPPPPRN